MKAYNDIKVNDVLEISAHRLCVSVVFVIHCVSKIMTQL